MTSCTNGSTSCAACLSACAVCSTACWTCKIFTNCSTISLAWLTTCSACATGAASSACTIGAPSSLCSGSPSGKGSTGRSPPFILIYLNIDFWFVSSIKIISLLISVNNFFDFSVFFE